MDHIINSLLLASWPCIFTVLFLDLGVLAHTQCDRGKESYAYIDLYDVNITLTILLKVLCNQKSSADVLYLQIDNCCKENKNQFLFAFCSLLVETKVFRKV